MNKLEDLYMQIVLANVVKKADDSQGNNNNVVGPNPPNQVSTPNTNSQPPKPQNPGSNTIKTAPTAPTANTQEKPAESTKQENSNQQNNQQNNKAENTTKLTNQPQQANKPPEAYHQSSNNLVGLISLGIRDVVNKYGKTTIYYMNPKIKSAILDRVAGKNVVIKFAGSNDKFPAIIDSDTYDHYVKAGMETVYVPLSKNESFFTFVVKNATSNTTKAIIKAMECIQQNKYVCDFDCVVQNNKQLNVVCSLDEFQDTEELPQIIIEAMMDIDDIIIELPTINRLCAIPESIIKPNKTL
jgi:hypothetical protein